MSQKASNSISCTGSCGKTITGSSLPGCRGKFTRTDSGTVVQAVVASKVCLVFQEYFCSIFAQVPIVVIMG